MWEMLLGYLNKVGIAEVVAICSMLAAWVAAREAIRSRRLMARMQQQSEQAIDIYSANHYVARSPKDAVHRFYVFHLLITNSSTVNNSIKAMELSLAFSQDKGPRPNIVCPHNLDSARCLEGLDSQQIFRVPRSIGAGDTISGIAVFAVATSLIHGRRTESCTVTVTDAHDREVRYESLILRELDHEEAPEKFADCDTR